MDFRDNRVSVLTDGTLMIHNTVDSDKGTYQCVVRTPNQEIRTNKVQLTYSRGIRIVHYSLVMNTVYKEIKYSPIFIFAPFVLVISEQILS